MMFLSNRGSFRPETSGAYTLRRRGRRRPKSGSAIGACAVARLAGSGGPIGDYYGSANRRYARGGTAALLPAPARKRRKGEAVDEGKTRRASRPARPMPCEQPPGLPEELPDDPAALKAIIADLELSNAALREVLAVLKAGAPALTNAEAAGCASRLEGAFGAAAACAALGLARST
ncbi:hypothetical protein, partial [Adlercreutzia rubneri]